MFDSSNLKTEKVYSVLELNNTVRRLIRSEFSGYIWVYGEIKDLRMSRNKRHIYFDLIQKHSEADEIVAKVSAAIFEGRKQRIFRRIKETEGVFDLKNDIEVKFLCEVDLYPKNGSYNLIIADIDPVYTLGKLAQNRQKIIEELKKENVFNKNKSLPLSPLILKIGLITAHESAAYHDFISELESSGFGFKVLLRSCHMQGKNTESDIVGAINFFNSSGRDRPDAIIVTRGGGSSADLSWFDNKRIAYAIINSKIPVLTALGHEINVSIADLVAHTALKTPTKAAQFLVENVNEVWNNLENIQNSLLRAVNRFVDGVRLLLERKLNQINNFVSIYFRDHHEDIIKKKSLIFNNVSHFINTELSNILVSSQRINSAASFCFRGQKGELEEKERFVFARVSRYMKRESGKIDDSFVVLGKRSNSILQKAYKDTKFIEEKVNILNPSNVMRRGYSVSYKDNKLVRYSSGLKRGDKLKTVFFKGRAFSRVEKTEGV
ncbi:MAG: exodeoxyribonuclease VII large subunit [Candidatus Omnitrophica bacterium 4484_171]|nr:MAG: exodeoxyribonuclease VII large subunit [Candidatus Omnitrophica bacterium 4484_171]